MELKVWADGKPDPLEKGLLQLDSYLSRLDLDHGYGGIGDSLNPRQGENDGPGGPDQLARMVAISSSAA